MPSHSTLGGSHYNKTRYGGFGLHFNGMNKNINISYHKIIKERSSIMHQGMYTEQQN